MNRRFSVATVAGLALLAALSIPMVPSVTGDSPCDAIGQVLWNPPFYVEGGALGQAYAAPYAPALAAGLAETAWRVGHDLPLMPVDGAHDGSRFVVVTGGIPATVVWYDPDGSIARTTDIPGLVPRALVVDEEGNAIVAGWQPLYEPTTATWYEMVAAKLSPEGDLLWRTVVGLGGAVDAQIDANGNVVVFGDYVTEEGNRHRSLLVAKLDPHGEILSVQDLGTPVDDYYITFGSVLASGDLAVTVHTFQRAPTNYLVRYAADGTYLGDLPFDHANIHEILPAADGGLLVHMTSEEWSFELIPHLRSTVVRLAPDFMETWRTSLVVGQWTYGGDMALDAAGNVVITGASYTHDTLVNLNPSYGFRDLVGDVQRIEQYVASVGADGTPLFARITGEHGPSSRWTGGWVVAVAPDGGDIFSAGPGESEQGDGVVGDATRSAPTSTLGVGAAAANLALAPVANLLFDDAVSPWVLTGLIPWGLVPAGDVPSLPVPGDAIPPVVPWELVPSCPLPV